MNYKSCGVHVVPMDQPGSSTITSTSNIAVIFFDDTIYTTSMTDSQAYDSIKKYKGVWSARQLSIYQPTALQDLQTKYDDKVLLYYVTPLFASPTGSISMSYSYLNYSDVHNNVAAEDSNTWMLLKDEVNAISSDYTDDDTSSEGKRYYSSAFAGSFYFDVGNEDFQDWAVEQLMDKINLIKETYPNAHFTGLAVDNVVFDTFSSAMSASYPNWKYGMANRTLHSEIPTWNVAYCSYLSKLKTALNRQNYILMANHTLDYSGNTSPLASDWSLLYTCADGLMNEEAMWMGSRVFQNSPNFPAENPYLEWDRSMAYHEAIIENRLYDFWESSITNEVDSDGEPTEESLQDNWERFLYVYCSFLLLKDPTYSLFGIYTRNEGSDTNLDSWKDEYDIVLGEPKDVRYEQNDCWVRDYTYGQVVVNPHYTSTRTFTYDPRFSYNWRTKTEISGATLSMAPTTATILLRTGYGN